MSAPQQLFPDCFFNTVWRPFLNATSPLEVIPAYAVMANALNDSAGNPFVIHVRKPFSAGDADFSPHAPFYVNSQFEIPAVTSSGNPTGFCSPLYNNPGLVAYDISSGTPVANEVWGPKSGSWLLTKNYPGFFIVGAPRTVNGIDVVPAIQQTAPIQSFFEDSGFAFLTAPGNFAISGGGGGASLGTSAFFNAGKANIFGRYEYDFFARVAATSLGSPVAANVVIQSCRVTAAGATVETMRSITCRPTATASSDGVLRGFVNLDYGEAVKIALVSASAGDTWSLSDVQMTVRYIGPQT